MKSLKLWGAGLALGLAVAVGCGQALLAESPEEWATLMRAVITFSRPAELVRDINPRPVPGSGSFPVSLTTMGGALYFAASGDGYGYELWRSDGTAQGTVCLDVIPGLDGLSPSDLTNVNGTLFFYRVFHGLWKSDGTTAGTVSIKDIPSYPGTQGLTRLTNVGGTLYFLAPESDRLSRLWKSDGTAAGTVKVKDVPVAPTNNTPQSLTQVDGKIFFASRDTATGLELWVSDGTATGTRLVKDLLPGSADSIPRELTPVGSTLFFVASGSRTDTLWKSDGTEAGTVPVSAEASDPRNLAAMNGVLYFQASSYYEGRELWRTDGTTAGTALVKNIAPNSHSSPANLTVVGSTLYFTADDGSLGMELWKSDGTAAGTVFVKDITPGTASTTFSNLTAVGSTLYFTADDGTHGLELWKSDGTAAGTVLVKDIVPGTRGASPKTLTDVGGRLAFVADDPSTGEEVWWSDGTEAGTRILKDLAGANAGSAPSDPLLVGNTLLFFATDGVVGRELWRTDGTAEGTVLVKDVRPGADSSRTKDVTYRQRVVGSTLYFIAEDGVSGEELWKSDGTPGGTGLVKDIRPGGFSSGVTFKAELGGTLFMTATDGTNGYELWKTDGTAAGTVMVKDLLPGSDSGVDGSAMVAFNGFVYFAGNDGTTGQELWKTDGTAAGTVRVKDIRSGSEGSLPDGFRVMNGLLYFAAEDAVSGRELWKTDGTEAGTRRVKDLQFFSGSSSPTGLQVKDGTLFFSATTSAYGAELWKSDGTEAGTVLVKDIQSGSIGSGPAMIATVGGLWFFTANDGKSGYELWRTDGTTEGTFLLKDIHPGSSTSGIYSATSLGNRLFFGAYNPTMGRELWVTDGTSSGTVLVRDLEPGAEGSEPRDLLALEPEGLLVFTAQDSNGRELWVTNGTATGTRRLTNVKGNFKTIGNPMLPVRLGDQLLYFADDQGLGMELWNLPPGTAPDTTPPTLGCPATHEQEATSSTGAVVSAVAVTVSDDVTASPTLRYSPALGSMFPLGATPLTVTAEDEAGNTAQCTLRVVVRDTTPPAVTCPANPRAEASEAAGARVGFSASASDAVTASPQLTYSHAPDSLFPEGSTSVTVTARDAAGNTSQCTFRVTVRDSTPPAVACPADTFAEASGPSGATVSYPPATASDTVTASPQLLYSHASGTAFPLGSTSVTVTARDTAGNTSQCAFRVTVRDSTPPALACPADTFAEASGPSGATVVYPPATASDTVTSSPSLLYSHASGTAFPLGSTSVTVTARDAAGNTSRCTFRVTVRDSTPPALACPADTFAEATGPTGAAAEYPPATASDAVTASPQLRYSQASGTLFPLGSTRLDVSARDEAGHVSTCHFTLTVRDTTPPTVSCLEDLTVEAVDATGAPVSFALPRPRDRVTREPVLTSSHAPGSRFPLGTTSVTLTAWDEADNTASCAFSVRVRDTTPPVLTCPANVTVETWLSEGETVTYPPAAARDAVTTSPALRYSKASGTHFPSGTTSVKVTARDEAGLTSACLFQVTVRPVDASR